jgi:hypothetical protein
MYVQPTTHSIDFDLFKIKEKLMQFSQPAVYLTWRQTTAEGEAHEIRIKFDNYL